MNDNAYEDLKSLCADLGFRHITDDGVSNGDILYFADIKDCVSRDYVKWTSYNALLKYLRERD